MLTEEQCCGISEIKHVSKKTGTDLFPWYDRTASTDIQHSMTTLTLARIEIALQPNPPSIAFDAPDEFPSVHGLIAPETSDVKLAAGSANGCDRPGRVSSIESARLICARPIDPTAAQSFAS